MITAGNGCFPLLSWEGTSLRTPTSSSSPLHTQNHPIITPSGYSKGREKKLKKMLVWEGGRRIKK